MFSTFSLSAFANTIDFEYWKKILNFWRYSKSSFWSQNSFTSFPQGLEERRSILEIWVFQEKLSGENSDLVCKGTSSPTKEKLKLKKPFLSTWGSCSQSSLIFPLQIKNKGQDDRIKRNSFSKYNKNKTLTLQLLLQWTLQSV